MNNLMDELPQLIISVFFLVLIGALLITRVITPDNPVFVVGSGSILFLIASYWLGNGLVRLSHTQTMRAAAQVQLIPPVAHTQSPTPAPVVPPPKPEMSYETTPIPAIAKPDETTQDHV